MKKRETEKMPGVWDSVETTNTIYNQRIAKLNHVFFVFPYESQIKIPNKRDSDSEESSHIYHVFTSLTEINQNT